VKNLQENRNISIYLEINKSAGKRGDEDNTIINIEKMIQGKVIRRAESREHGGINFGGGK
jgi:hypothetical protein